MDGGSNPAGDESALNDGLGSFRKLLANLRLAVSELPADIIQV